MTLPPIVTPEQWQAARDALLVKEKAATRALDALAAERRRLPMVAFPKEYRFEGPDGAATLPELFDGRSQLIVYHFMAPTAGRPCKGCAGFTDNLGNLAHLRARDTTLVLTSPAPTAELEAVRARMGWTVPWYSTLGSGFDADCGLDGGFGLSVFLRDGDRVHRSYFTTARGVDRLRGDFNLLDLTPFGRQETWEDSPEGRPQSAPYHWWRLHDEYEHEQNGRT
ncbi:DUF899 domain-containing protein [Streptomyces sp. TLI_171]|uniref:DUF899 domain-containing protein n=1 Tax=Streptomyces sp. TLI_171 TaxID=1938859 RepID=UPI000C19B61C|nr:DUF899 domain-containing protein [Streptomyces sp. TLI_171]RKE17514.1 putative dithiol-disulfide oxidoreductase (DUF899 family) [Streptomyces sp. TLI_171]